MRPPGADFPLHDRPAVRVTGWPAIAGSGRALSVRLAVGYEPGATLVAADVLAAKFPSPENTATTGPVKGATVTLAVAYPSVVLSEDVPSRAAPLTNCTVPVGKLPAELV